MDPTTTTPEEILTTAGKLRWTVPQDFHDKIVENVYAESARLARRNVSQVGVSSQLSWQKRLDRLLTGKWTGIPTMVFIFAIVLWLTIEGANVPSSMLAGLLMSEPLSELHERVEAGFLESARRIPGPFRDWCSSDHAALFHEAVFRVFLRLDLRTLKPVTNELLQNGTASQRRQLVKAFSQDGSPKALELLLAVLSDAPRTAGRDDRNVDIVEALGGFRHSKAVEAVSNVIESNNKASCNKALATAAIKALARMQTREAREALRKVAEERRWLRYRYRPQLRTLAVQIMLREEGLR